MKKFLSFLLSLSLLACSLQSTLPNRGQVAPNPAPVPQQMVTITGTVYIRDENGETSGHVLREGTVVWGHVSGDEFVINGGYSVFLGCTSKPMGMGCEAR